MDKASGAIEMSIYYYDYCYYYQQLQNEVTESGVCRYFHTAIFDEQELEIRHPPSCPLPSTPLQPTDWNGKSVFCSAEIHTPESLQCVLCSVEIHTPESLSTIRTVLANRVSKTSRQMTRADHVFSFKRCFGLNKHLFQTN